MATSNHIPERYTNRMLYFNEQVHTTHQFVIPYINRFLPIQANMRVLEIGCGEGGNLKPFIDMGCEVVGNDINEEQIENAKIYLKEQCTHQNFKLIARDIYQVDANEIGQFDLIFMRDVIEHIHDQKKFLGHLKQFLKPKGAIFFGFPPWYMPYGGHQQASHNSFLPKMPYVHILPTPIYKGIMKMVKVSPENIESLLEIKETGISIERFRRIVAENGYKIWDESLYLINPNYEVKFNLKTRKQLGWISKMPFIRNFLTTCAYYIIGN